MIIIPESMPAPNFLDTLVSKVLRFNKTMLKQKTKPTAHSDTMIVLGVHISGVIDCDAKPITIPRSLTYKYFQSDQVKLAIQHCIERAKDNPLQRHIANKIRVQASQTIGMAIKSGTVQSILGLADFLEEIKKETNTITVIGRNAKENEIVFL